MPEYLSPGVYVEEIEVGTKPIEGVATSNLGIVGPTERGPVEVRLVTSWLEFQRLYGGPAGTAAASHMPHAVKGYFDNGGRRLFVARVASIDAANPAVAGSAALGNLTLTALGPGASGNNILVSVTDPTQQDPANPGQPHPDRFRLVLAYYSTLPNTSIAATRSPTFGSST